MVIRSAPRTKNVFSFIRKHSTLITLLLILALGAFLRLYNLSGNVPALSQDEVVNGYDAYALGHTLKDHHGSFLPVALGSFGDSASVALTYLTIPFVMIGGLTDFTVRLPVVLTGIASIFLLYLFLKEVSGKRQLGLLGAFILAIIPWHITLTRWAIPPSIVPFFLLLFLYLFSLAVKRKERTIYYLIGAGISAGFLTYSYPSAIVFAPLFLVSLAVIYFYKEWRKVLILIGSYVITTLPLFYSLFFAPSENFRRFGSVRLTSQGPELVGDVSSRYVEYYSPRFLFGDTGANVMMHVPGSGNFYIFLSIFLVAAIATVIYALFTQRKRILKKIRKLNNLRLIIAGIIWSGLATLPASVTIDHEHLTRAIALLPLLTILVTLATYYTFQQVPRIRQPFMLIFFLFLSFYSLISYQTAYTGSYRALSADTQFHYGVREGLAYTTAHDSKYSQVVIDTSINQPYIYYLFYSSYDPSHLNYAEMNANLTNGQPYSVPKIGKYTFRHIEDSDTTKATSLITIQGFNKTYYQIFEKDDTLFMRKTDMPWQG